MFLTTHTLAKMGYTPCNSFIIYSMKVMSCPSCNSALNGIRVHIMDSYLLTLIIMDSYSYLWTLGYFVQ